MDILGALAARAVHISNQAKDLSNDISNAAVEIQARVEVNEADSAKLKQLQALLKGIA
jgi:hypothetical protein